MLHSNDIMDGVNDKKKLTYMGFRNTENVL